MPNSIVINLIIPRNTVGYTRDNIGTLIESYIGAEVLNEKD